MAEDDQEEPGHEGECPLRDEHCTQSLYSRWHMNSRRPWIADLLPGARGSLRGDAESWLFDLIVNVVLASWLVPRLVRSIVLRAIGVNIATNLIYPGCKLRTKMLSVGHKSLINTCVQFENNAPIEIGTSVGVGMCVMFITSTHEIGPSACRTGPLRFEPIRVEDGCWIGSGATVLPGVTIGRGCIVAAGSVVTGDCAPDGFYAGVPARRIRDL